jgi:hypothetical protein
VGRDDSRFAVGLPPEAVREVPQDRVVRLEAENVHVFHGPGDADSDKGAQQKPLGLLVVLLAAPLKARMVPQHDREVQSPHCLTEILAEQGMMPHGKI